MHNDQDPLETQEWLDAINSTHTHAGSERTQFLLTKLSSWAMSHGYHSISSITTPYCNTIPSDQDKKIPGNFMIEKRIRAFIRWNALAIVMRANRKNPGIGGHISSFSSSATLYDVGFNYFFRGPNDSCGGDIIYFQGHISPGIYARSFLEGRFTEDQLDLFRQEVDGNGLSSYPHPWLMPNYWQFPTVSMGLGPIQAIYQAYVMRYQQNRSLLSITDKKVWAFLGDGECDEPESLGSISLAGREKLDNLCFVVNCNLQRLDGLVRGNGNIIQELEGVFRGAGWNVIKVIWGKRWDALLAKDHLGLLQKRMNEVCDGDLQNYKNKGGAYTRQHFFGKYPELLEMVSDLSDKDIMYLNRGGHDPDKVYTAYSQAIAYKGRPTVILAQTVKGYGMGEAGEADNIAHSVKTLDIENLKKFRDRFDIPITDKNLDDVPYYSPPRSSPEMQYMLKHREKLGGFIPQRNQQCPRLMVPSMTSLHSLLSSTEKREISTTMGFVKLLSLLSKDSEIGERVVPIVPDEARTFGMEGMFRQLGIYSSQGQRYMPHDSDKVLFYKESKKGQIMEEGINESGAMSAWIAQATSYSTYGQAMIPFYVFYSMFGFQRVMDLIWAAGDIQARGFLIGATAGRTTLNGEGLQHQDGHSLLMANMVPNCISYDPTYIYELVVIIQNGLDRMYQKQDNIFYYITVMNENYKHKALPEGIEEQIIRGMYKLKTVGHGSPHTVQLMGSGTILREIEAAAELLSEEWGIDSSVWSLTSINELSRNGCSCARFNRLHPSQQKKIPYIVEQLRDHNGPVVVSTDYIKLYGEQLRPYIPQKHYTVLGTDGYGRSDTRKKLRKHFEIDRFHIVLAALNALFESGEIENKTEQVIKKYNMVISDLDPMYS
jgi:pyruvate dehydrogenase E1 component